MRKIAINMVAFSCLGGLLAHNGHLWNESLFFWLAMILMAVVQFNSDID